MSIIRIEIKNFKSIDDIKLDIDQLNIFVGQNGTGKTTIQKAIEYFYANLTENNYLPRVLDIQNQYKSYMEITITYDFSSTLSKSNGVFYDTIQKMLNINGSSPYAENVISLTLKQDRKGNIEWSHKYQYRYIIKNTQPIYFIKAREKDIRDWNDLWDAFGGYVNANAAKSISKGINNILPEREAIQFQDYVDQINIFLKEQNIQIKEQTNTNKIINLLKLYLGGDDFENNKRSLDFFSEGTNSKNYIVFMSFIAYITSLKRLKDATVIIDEPEMGLHLKMIDTLMDSLVNYSKKVKFILLTHSPRLASIGLKEVGKLYKVNIENGYTVVKQVVKNNTQIKQLSRLSDTESGMLFSDFLLFVEGVSEYELFTHKKLKTLFPVLKEIDVVNTNSDNPVIDLLISGGIGIPYMNLLDLDKVVAFESKGSNDYEIKVKKYPYCAIKNKRRKKYMKNSYNKYSKTLKEIQMIEELHKEIITSSSVLGVRPTDFENIFKMIQSVCDISNIYLNKVDIEYVLACSATFDEWFLSYIKGNNKKKQILDSFKNCVEKNILRTWLVEGKDEFLNKIKNPDVQSNFPVLYSEFNSKRLKKADGWVSNYLDFYFEKNRGLDKKSLIDQFKLGFPDLYDIISAIKVKRNE